MTIIIELETERLCLRQWQATDFKPFAELNADAKVMAYFPNRLTRAESDAMAMRCQALIAERGWGFWAVELKATHDFIGFVGLHIPSANLPFSPCVEIGWRLAVRYWRQGYATEAAQAALTVGFERLNLPEIVAFAALHNTRSRAVMQRLGMIEQPTTFLHPDLNPTHALAEHCWFKLSNPNLTH